MTNLIKKLSVRIVIALVLGLLLASRTTIQVPCSTVPTTVPTGEDIEKCIAFDDAFNQPRRLFANEQNSLVRFTTTFAITSIASFGTLSLYSLYKNRKPK